MSTALLSTLTLGGIALLSFFAYAVHKVEEHRQEKSRRSQLHRDRARDLAFVAEVLPREAVDPELFKALYHNVELYLTHAVELDSENVELRERLNGVAQTNKLVQRGAEVPQAPLGGTLGEQMKDSQRALKMLKDFILQQHKAGVLTKSGATKFVRTLQDINLRVMLRGLIGQAKHNVREGHKSLPIHYYQLAYNELLKANQGNRHIEEMTELAEMIKVLKDAQGRVGEVGEETARVSQTRSRTRIRPLTTLLALHNVRIVHVRSTHGGCPCDGSLEFTPAHRRTWQLRRCEESS